MTHQAGQLFPFLKDEETRNISTPAGWDAKQFQGEPLALDSAVSIFTPGEIVAL